MFHLLVLYFALSFSHSRLELPWPSDPMTHDIKFECSGILEMNYYGVNWSRGSENPLLIRIQKEHHPILDLRIMSFSRFQRIHGAFTSDMGEAMRWERIKAESQALRAASSQLAIASYNYRVNGGLDKIANISQVRDISSPKEGFPGIYSFPVEVPDSVQCNDCVLILRQDHPAPRGYYSCARIGLR